MELQAKYHFGNIAVQVDGDLLRMEAHGGLGMAAAQQMLELFRLMQARHGRFFLLGDLKDGGGVPPDVRRLLAHETVLCPPAAVAFYGGSLPIRASNALMMAAVRQMRGPLGGTSQNITSFATAAEAEAWIVAERQRLAAP